MAVPNVTQPVSNKGRLVFTAISVACILVTILLTWKRAERSVIRRETTAWERFHLPPLPRAHFSIKKFLPETTSSAALTAATADDISDDPPALTPALGSHLAHRGADTLSLKTFSTPSMTFDGIGVVDMHCLLIVHPPNSDSKEARFEAIAEIQRVIAARAAAHDLVVVLDRSGQGLNAVPVVLSSTPAFDLTQEVVTQLTEP